MNGSLLKWHSIIQFHMKWQLKVANAINDHFMWFVCSKAMALAFHLYVLFDFLSFQVICNQSAQFSLLSLTINHLRRTLHRTWWHIKGAHEQQKKCSNTGNEVWKETKKEKKSASRLINTEGDRVIRHFGWLTINTLHITQWAQFRCVPDKATSCAPFTTR